MRRLLTLLAAFSVVASACGTKAEKSASEPATTIPGQSAPLAVSDQLAQPTGDAVLDGVDADMAAFDAELGSLDEGKKS